MKITKRQLRRIIKEERARLLNEGPNLALRNAIMDTYETVYDNAMQQYEDEGVAQDMATDAVMSEVEAWLDAVGISRTYVGLS